MFERRKLARRRADLHLFGLRGDEFIC